MLSKLCSASCVAMSYISLTFTLAYNLVIRCTLIIKLIVFCRDHLQAHALNKWGLRYLNCIPLSLLLIVCIKFSDFEQVKFSVY